MSRHFVLALLSAFPAVSGAAQERPPAERITDPRDGYAYRVVPIGGLRWFAENLRFRTPDSRCYENDETNCADHGRLYRFDDAVQACPAGWRVPSEEDWRGLERALGMPEDEIVKDRGRGHPLGRRLKLGGDSGFDVRYSGWIDPHRADSSRAMGRAAAFWTSTYGDPDDHSATVWHRDVAATRHTIWRSPVNVTYWLSVRCVAGR